MRLLVVGNPVVHLDTADGVLWDGALAVKDGRIESIGPRSELEAGSYDRVLGGDDHFVLPGLINAHFHSETALTRGVSSGRTFERSNIWMHRLLGPIDEDDLLNATLVRLAQIVRGGQTGVLDVVYGRPSLPELGLQTLLEAYAGIGLRVALGVATRDQNVYVHQPDAEFLAAVPPALAEEVRRSPIGYAWPVDAVLETFRSLADRWHGRDGRIALALAPDWAPSCSDDLYLRSARVAEEFATGLTTHALETRWELLFHLERYGETPIQRLDRLGVLRPNVTLAHCVWATDEDLRLAAARDVVIAHSPAANLRSSSGICRIADFLRMGGSVGIATDGNGFSESDDLLAELRLASLLQRQPANFASKRIPSATLFRSALLAGAQAIGGEERVGRLARGCDADLVLYRSDAFWPSHRYAGSNPLDVILDRANASELRAVLVRGRVLFEDGRITTIDEERVRAKFADAAANRLWRALDDAERRWIHDVPRRLEPYVDAFYERWAAAEMPPGHAYNTVAETPEEIAHGRKVGADAAARAADHLE